MSFASKSAVLLAGVAILAGGCAGEKEEAAEPTRDIAGPCQPAFGTPACTWARMEGSEVEAFGATVSIASIEQ